MPQESAPDDPRPRVREVAELVRLLSLESGRYVDDVARRLRLHRSDVAAMGAMIEAARGDEYLTPTEIAHAMGLSQAAISALLQRLEGAGHVSRRRHQRDGRKVVVELADSARATSARMFLPLNDEMAEALSGYSPAELDTAARVLRDLVRAAWRARPPAGPEPGTHDAHEDAHPGLGTGRGPLDAT